MSNSSHSPHDTNQSASPSNAPENSLSDPLQYSKNPSTTFLEVKELWMYATGDQITLTRPDTPIAVPLEETSIEATEADDKQSTSHQTPTPRGHTSISQPQETLSPARSSANTGKARYRHGITTSQSATDTTNSPSQRRTVHDLNEQPSHTHLQPADVPQTFAGKVTATVTYQSQLSHSHIRELTIDFADETSEKLPADITGATLYSLVPASTQAIDPEDIGDTVMPVPLLEFHTSWDPTADTIETIPTLSITESNCYRFADPEFRHPLVRMGLGQVEYMDMIATATLEPTGTINLYQSRAVDEITHEVGYITAKYPLQRMTLPEFRTLIAQENVVPKSEYATAMLSKI